MKKMFLIACLVVAGMVATNVTSYAQYIPSPHIPFPTPISEEEGAYYGYNYAVEMQNELYIVYSNKTQYSIGYDPDYYTLNNPQLFRAWLTRYSWEVKSVKNKIKMFMAADPNPFYKGYYDAFCNYYYEGSTGGNPGGGGLQPPPPPDPDDPNNPGIVIIPPGGSYLPFL